MNGTSLGRESFELMNFEHEPIRGDLRFSNDAVQRKPVVIVCHSFMAFKDWGFFPRVGEKFAELGLASITFNFSRNGVSGNGSRITEFDLFASNTFTREIEDLGVVIDAVSGKRLGSEVVDERRIALLGHSRGGGVAIIRTAADRRVSALATWSAISTFDRWTQRQKERWRKEGRLPLSKDSSASPLRLDLSLLDDLERNRDRLNILDAAARINVPWLVLHGKADVTVPAAEAEALCGAASKNTTECVVLDQIGHLYNAASGTEDRYKTLDGIIELTAGWLLHHFT